MKVQPTRAHWESLIGAALIGSDRAGQRTPGDLLTEAGVIGTMRRAGFALQAGAPAHSECVDETASVCSHGARGLLVRLIKASEWTLVEEWASLATSRGCIVPAALLPELFDASTSRPSLRASIRGCIGARGDWLARQRDEWKDLHTPAALQDFSAEWATATGAQRRDWLAEVRQREPARAIELLEITWGTDSADERRRFVEIMGVGLSLADEPFLEKALADRSKLVREAAAGLLGSLAGSRFVERMTRRAEGLIKAAGGKGLLKRKARVAVFPPESWDPEWERDALEEKPPQGIGKRAYWLRQILSAVPPAHWSRTLELTPEEILAGLEESDYRADVIAAWMVAAPRFRDMEWCAALALHGPATKKKRESENLEPLWEALPPSEREAVLSRVVGEVEGNWDLHWNYAASAAHPWSGMFSRQMVAALKKHVPARAPDWYQVGPAIDRITHCIDPSSATEFEQIVEQIFKNDVSPSVASSLDRLRLRVEMHKEFGA